MSGALSESLAAMQALLDQQEEEEEEELTLEVEMAEPPKIAEGFALSQQAATDIGRRSKEFIMLGILGQIEKLQEEWDGRVPEDLPFDPEIPTAGGKAYETITSFIAREKGRQQVMSITGGAKVCVALYESLARVISASPKDIEYQQHPRQRLLLAIDDNELADDKCTVHDSAIVRQMLLVTQYRIDTKLTLKDRYGGRDTDLLKQLRDKTCPEVSTRLERWGMQIAQLYIDFLRTIGELAANQLWEKKATLDEAMLRRILRDIGLITRYPLPYETMSDICDRTLS